ncbi:MAG: cupin domain-containing protein [Candidatus Manganitrophus sp.]|nr:MAG: cupin domain-containing protein [Candidatus Manganitrophus sp.]
MNLKDIPDETWSSPKGKFGGASKEISIALGRKPSSTDLKDRHPFDVELCRLPPGKIHSPYHSHSAQWEFHHVISGAGLVRHQEGTTPIGPGDAFLFEPGQPHQLINNGAEDLVLYVVADNPIGESAHYPDSKKWLVRSPERRVIRPDGPEELDYYSGEE